jgi:hypothetical protein
MTTGLLTGPTAQAAHQAILDLVDADTDPGYVELLDGATVLATFTLAATAFTSATNPTPPALSTAGLAGTLPIEVNASATGDIDGYNLRDGADVLVHSASGAGVVSTSEGAIVVVNTLSTVSGEPVRLVQFNSQFPTVTVAIPA